MILKSFQSFQKYIKRIANLFFIGLIVLYQRCISPYTPGACRFLPTCSAYGIEAFKKYGPLGGLRLTVKRILKCHPVVWLGGSSGYDPVPDTPQKKDDS